MSFYDKIVYREDGYVYLTQEVFDEMCNLLPNPDDYFWLTKAQMARILPFLPKSRGNKRVDDLRVLSGIIHVLKTGCRWRDAPKIYGSYSTLYSRFRRWSLSGVFNGILWRLAGQDADLFALMIDSMRVAVHRTACSMSVELGLGSRRIDRTPGGLSSKIHAVADARGRPVLLLLTSGTTSDYTGAEVMSDDFPLAKYFLGDRGYDATWLRELLQEMGMEPCIKPRKNRKDEVDYDVELYKTRHRIENCFGRIKDWRRVWARYDRCPIIFTGACTLAAIVTHWL